MQTYKTSLFIRAIDKYQFVTDLCHMFELWNLR